MMSTCGGCIHAEALEGAAVIRCYGAPPTVVQRFVTGEGQVTVVSEYPLLATETRACGMFKHAPKKKAPK